MDRNRLRVEEFKVYLYIAYYHDAVGYAPTVREVAATTMMSQSQAARIIKRLWNGAWVHKVLRSPRTLTVRDIQRAAGVNSYSILGTAVEYLYDSRLASDLGQRLMRTGYQIEKQTFDAQLLTVAIVMQESRLWSDAALKILNLRMIQG